MHVKTTQGLAIIGHNVDYTLTEQINHTQNKINILIIALTVYDNMIPSINDYAKYPSVYKSLSRITKSNK